MRFFVCKTGRLNWVSDFCACGSWVLGPFFSDSLVQNRHPIFTTCINWAPVFGHVVLGCSFLVGFVAKLLMDLQGCEE